MRIHISLLWIPISILWIHISALLCATASIHIYLYCEYKLYIKMHRCMYTYICIVDRYINLKMCHCIYINWPEHKVICIPEHNFNKHTTNTDLPHLPLILSKKMRTECATLCIVLVIMSSTISSCDPCKFITSFVLTIIPLMRGL